MHTVTTKLPEELNIRLENLAHKADRKKSYLVRKAIEEFLNDEEDYYDALAILTRGEKTYSLESVEKELGLDN